MNRRHNLNRSSDIECSTVCSNMIRNKGYWKTHVTLVHTREKTFCCTECTYSATLRSTLELQIQNMHGKTAKIFKCGMCSYSTNEKFKFNRHVKTTHRQE